MKERENGYNGGTATYGQSNYYNGSSDESAEMNNVHNYLNARRYREALNLLAGITTRSARWYYYSAVGNAGVGNNVMAFEHAQQAVNMEPGNTEYANVLNQLQWQNKRYQNNRYNNGGYGSGGYGNRGGLGSGNLCCDLWCADSLCECMGGDLISCC